MVSVLQGWYSIIGYRYVLYIEKGGMQSWNATTTWPCFQAEQMLLMHYGYET